MEKLPELYQSLFKATLPDSDAEEVSKLFHKGADLGYIDPNTGRTALYNATITNMVMVIEALLQHGADPNQRFTYRSPVDGRVEADRTALHYATSSDAAAVLIKAGADVNATDATGITPLMHAAFYGHITVVRELLAAGASPLARQKKVRGKKPCTARELAESKIEYFREIICDDNREAAALRIRCYEEIRDILSEAEMKSTK
jgi:ankyrin repeat protein